MQGQDSRSDLGLRDLLLFYVWCKAFGKSPPNPQRVLNWGLTLSDVHFTKITLLCGSWTERAVEEAEGASQHPTVVVQERTVEAWTRLAVMEIGEKKNGNVLQKQSQQDFLKDRMWRAKEGKDSFGFDLSIWLDDRTLTGVRSLREEEFERRKQEFCLSHGGHTGRNAKEVVGNVLVRP